MSDSEPIDLHGRWATADHECRPTGERSGTGAGSGGDWRRPVFFDRRELDAILRVYGHKVAAGEWRDYAIDADVHEATFSVFRRTAEVPIYRVVKTPKDARKQGAYRIIGATGMILKRGHDLAQVLKVFNKRRLSVVGS